MHLVTPRDKNNIIQLLFLYYNDKWPSTDYHTIDGREPEALYFIIGFINDSILHRWQEERAETRLIE